MERCNINCRHNERERYDYQSRPNQVCELRLAIRGLRRACSHDRFLQMNRVQTPLDGRLKPSDAGVDSACHSNDSPTCRQGSSSSRKEHIIRAQVVWLTKSSEVRGAAGKSAVVTSNATFGASRFKWNIRRSAISKHIIGKVKTSFSPPEEFQNGNRVGACGRLAPLKSSIFRYRHRKVIEEVDCIQPLSELPAIRTPCRCPIGSGLVAFGSISREGSTIVG